MAAQHDDMDITDAGLGDPDARPATRPPMLGTPFPLSVCHANTPSHSQCGLAHERHQNSVGLAAGLFFFPCAPTNPSNDPRRAAAKSLSNPSRSHHAPHQVSDLFLLFFDTHFLPPGSKYCQPLFGSYR